MPRPKGAACSRTMKDTISGISVSGLNPGSVTYLEQSDFTVLGS